MRLTLEKRITALVATFGILTALIIGAVIWPTMRYILVMNRDTNELKLTLEEKYQQSRRARLSLHKVKELKEATVDYDRHVFHPGSQLPLITLLEQSAAQHHVMQKIESSNLDAIPGERLTFSISATGDARDLMRYLAAIEHLDYFITTEVIQLSPAQVSGFASESEEAPLAALRLTMNVYVAP